MNTPILLPAEPVVVEALLSAQDVHTDAGRQALAAALSAALHSAMTDTARYTHAGLTLDTAHPHAIATALLSVVEYGARVNYPLHPPAGLMVYVDQWVPLEQCAVGYHIPTPEVAQCHQSPATEPAEVTPPRPLSTELPDPSVQAPPADGPGRPRKSAFEIAFPPRTRLGKPPFWWEPMFDMAGAVFSDRPAVVVGETRASARPQAYALLVHLLERALASAPPDVTVGQLHAHLMQVRESIDDSPARTAIQPFVEELTTPQGG